MFTLNNGDIDFSSIKKFESINFLKKFEILKKSLNEIVAFILPK